MCFGCCHAHIAAVEVLGFAGAMLVLLGVHLVTQPQNSVFPSQQSGISGQRVCKMVPNSILNFKEL